MNLRGFTGLASGSAPLARGASVPYGIMSQPSMSGVHVPTLLKVVRRRKRRKKKVAKHLGPGPHPSGTEQDVHGRGRQRRSYTETEHQFAQERTAALRAEMDELRAQRHAMVTSPNLDLDAYEALNQQIQDRMVRMDEFINRSVRPRSTPPETGIHRFTGSLSHPQIEAIGRRLEVLDATRSRLIERLETEFDTPHNLGDMTEGAEQRKVREQIAALDLEEGELLIALTTPTLPGFEAPVKALPEPSEKDARSYSTKSPKTGKIIDPMPVADAGGDGEVMAQAIFEVQLEIDGETYDVQLEDYQEREYGMGDTWKRVQGRIYHEGNMVGRFNRSFPNDYTVNNDEFYIDQAYQGRGIGTMLLAHWEGELADAGIREMHVTAAEIGRYAWAVSGYDWDGFPPSDIMDELVHSVQNYNTDLGLDPFDYSYRDGDDETWNEARRMVQTYDEYDEPPQPWELAMLGAGTNHHLGKEILLSDGMWDGIKYLDH